MPDASDLGASRTPPRLLRWETLTKRAFDELDPARCTVLVTCSPLEVHGPHLPLGADALEGEGLAERVLHFLPPPHRERTFLKLPFVYAGTDVVPQRGSLWFRPGTVVRMLEDLGGSLGGAGRSLPGRVGRAHRRGVHRCAGGAAGSRAGAFAPLALPLRLPEPGDDPHRRPSAGVPQ